MNISKQIHKKLFSLSSIMIATLSILLAGQVWGQGADSDFYFDDLDYDSEIPEGAVFLTDEELDVRNNAPHVSIGSLNLEKDNYEKGETVRGTFSLLNQRNYDVYNIYYTVSLDYGDSGDFFNTPEGRFDSKTYDSVNLTASQRQNFSFDYEIPDFVLGEDFSIQVEVYQKSGLALAWAHERINLASDGPIFMINESYLEVAGFELGVQEGPIVKDGRELILKIEILNPTNSNVQSSFNFDFHERSIVNESYRSHVENVTLEPGVNNLSFKIDPENDKPGVYETLLTIKDDKDNLISEQVPIRYTVGGDIVTIQNISYRGINNRSFDIIPKGKILTMEMQYSGGVYDILAAPDDQDNYGKYRTEIYLRDQNDNVVSSFIGEIDYNQGITKEIDFVIDRDIETLKTNITVFNDAGEIITTYENIIFPAPGGGGLIDSEDGMNRNVLIAISIIILLLIIGILFKFKGKKSAVISLLVLFSLIGYGLITINNNVSASEEIDMDKVVDIQRIWGYNFYGLQLSINSPKYYLEPGEVFCPNIIVYSYSCSNAGSIMINRVSGIFDITDYPTTWGELTNAQKDTLYGTRENHQVGRPWTRVPYDRTFRNYTTHNLHLCPEGGYTAPDKPGRYRIHQYLNQRRTWDNANGAALYSFFDFEVIATDPVDGECNVNVTNQIYEEAPGDNRCAAGNNGEVSDPSDIGVYSWICEGQFEGEDSLICETQPQLPTPGSCGSQHGNFAESLNEDSPNLCDVGDLDQFENNPDGTYSWMCNGVWESNDDASCNTIANPAIDGTVSCTLSPIQAVYDGTEDLTFNASVNFDSTHEGNEYIFSDHANVEYNWEGDMLLAYYGLNNLQAKPTNFGSLADNHYEVWVEAEYFGETTEKAYCGFQGSEKITVSRVPEIKFNIPRKIANEAGSCIAEWEIEYGTEGQAKVTCQIINNFGQSEGRQIGPISSDDKGTENVRAGNSYKLECTSDESGISITTDDLLVCVDPNVTER